MLISGNKARKNPYFNMVELKKKNSLKLVKQPSKYYVRHQDTPKVYELNASIYIWKRKALFDQLGPFCKKTFDASKQSWKLYTDALTPPPQAPPHGHS